MKQKLSLIGINLFILSLLLIPVVGRLSAATGEGGGPGSGGVLQNPLQANNFSELLELILSAVVQVGLVVVTFFIIWAGFLYVKAQGKPGDLDKAHKAITWTIIGSAIVLGAYAIKAIIYNTVTGLTEGL